MNDSVCLERLLSGLSECGHAAKPGRGGDRSRSSKQSSAHRVTLSSNEVAQREVLIRFARIIPERLRDAPLSATSVKFCGNFV